MNDPNESYKIEHSPTDVIPKNWVTLNHNGVPWFHGPLDVIQKLATDPEARKAARQSKMHHDRAPTK